MPQFKLVYFNLRGRAEASRMLFALADQVYEDHRINYEDWPKFKESTPYGQLPYLEVDGKFLCQSHAMERYLVNLFGYAGKTAWDRARADMIVDCMEDCLNPVVAIFEEQDKDKKNILSTKYIEDLTNLYQRLEKLLVGNDGGDGYFVGDDITYADMVVHTLADVVPLGTGGHDVDWTKFPKISALRQRVDSYPKIAEWVAKRPKTDG